MCNIHVYRTHAYTPVVVTSKCVNKNMYTRYTWWDASLAKCTSHYFSSTIIYLSVSVKFNFID